MKTFKEFVHINNLSPADKGILSATLNDAKQEGLGDDDTVDMLTNSILNHDITNNKKEAESLAYDFFRKYNKN